jgi:hypothetical protein
LPIPLMCVSLLDLNLLDHFELKLLLCTGYLGPISRGYISACSSRNGAVVSAGLFDSLGNNWEEVPNIEIRGLSA